MIKTNIVKKSVTIIKIECDSNNQFSGGMEAAERRFNRMLHKRREN